MTFKFLLILSSLFVSNFFYSQNEFITVWKPDNPSSLVLNNSASYSTSQQIWLPTRGNNYSIYWEEIGSPTHNATLTNVNSAQNILIDFGTPQTSAGLYRVKVSNGNGTFKNIQFADNSSSSGSICGDNQKIITVEQWGNIQWETMANAFFNCINLDITATDIPNLSNTTSMFRIFSMCENLTFNSSINNWNISAVTNLEEAFYFNALFNQPLSNWNTVNVMNMHNTFSMATEFNQNIGNWDVHNVKNMDGMFSGAANFNQSLGQWNLSSLLPSAANNMLTGAGLNCQNYTNTLDGWSANPLTPNNINLGNVSPLVYYSSYGRSMIISSKHWTFYGDTYNPSCYSELATAEVSKEKGVTIYPNPTSEYIYFKNSIPNSNYKILDYSGRILQNDKLESDKINIQNLTSGNYILQIINNDKIMNIKFSKK